MHSYQKHLGLRWAFLLGLTMAASSAQAAVVAIGPGAFGAGSSLITFGALTDGTEVNGLITGGVAFGYSLGNGQLAISFGPGTTNNLQVPSIVSVGNNAGILSLTLPNTVNAFGYGYAILTQNTSAAATTINLFSGATNVGTLSYAGQLDPFFAGGFAGIQSTIPFNRVALTFDAVNVPAFAVDNIRFSPVSTNPIPEPSAGVLLLSGAFALMLRKGLRKRTG